MLAPRLLLGQTLKLPVQTLRLLGQTLRLLGQTLRLPGQTLRLSSQSMMFLTKCFLIYIVNSIAPPPIPLSHPPTVGGINIETPGTFRTP